MQKLVLPPAEELQNSRALAAKAALAATVPVAREAATGNVEFLGEKPSEIGEKPCKTTEKPREIDGNCDFQAWFYSICGTLVEQPYCILRSGMFLQKL